MLSEKIKYLSKIEIKNKKKYIDIQNYKNKKK